MSNPKAPQKPMNRDLGALYRDAKGVPYGRAGNPRKPITPPANNSVGSLPAMTNEQRAQQPASPGNATQEQSWLVKMAAKSSSHAAFARARIAQNDPAAHSGQVINPQNGNGNQGVAFVPDSGVVR